MPPKATFHFVNAGDTVFAISRSYGVDMGRLIHANNMRKPYVIKQGVKLRIPSSTLSFGEKKAIASGGEGGMTAKGQRLALVVQKDLDKLDYGLENPTFVLPNKVKSEAEFSAVLMNDDSNLGKIAAGAPRPIGGRLCRLQLRCRIR